MSKEKTEKTNKPFYKRVWFWLIVVIVFLAVCSSGGNKQSTQTNGSQEVSIAETSQNAEASAATIEDNKEELAADQNVEGAIAEKSDVTNSSEAEYAVPVEYRNALISAEGYSNVMNMSKQAIYDQLTSEYGDKFDTDAAQYAVDNMTADWNENALETAENYSKTMNMSKQAIYDQLISEYGSQFTEEQAQYAVDNMTADWNANALASAEAYQDTMSMSKQAIYEQLISEYGAQFTAEQAQYAIDHLE